MSNQVISSAKTSINHVPALFKKYAAALGPVNLDYGAGKYDTGHNYLTAFGIKNYRYDPFNLPASINTEVLIAYEQFNTITLSNVLNVIHDDKALLEICRNLSNLMFNAAHEVTLFISIYEGDRSSIGKETTRGWQRNQKAAEYMTLLNHFFVTVRHGNMFICKTKAQF